MPDALHVPLIEAHHRRAWANPRRIGCGTLILCHARCVIAHQRMRCRSQQGCAAPRNVVAEGSGAIATRQWEAFPKNDVSGVESITEVMNRDAGGAIIAIIGPEERQ